MSWETSGFYAVHYRLLEAQPISLYALKELLLGERVKYTGWPPFWFPTRDEIAPTVIDENTYECFHDGTGRTHHVEKWRASATGEFTIVRQHDLDETYPGKYIGLTLPVWRIAEILLHAGRMGSTFQAANVEFTVQFAGLCGRELTAKHQDRQALLGTFRTEAEEYSKTIVIPVADIDRQVAQYTDTLLRPFYEMFQFKLPPHFCEEEIAELRKNRF